MPSPNHKLSELCIPFSSSRSIYDDDNGMIYDMYANWDLQ